MRTIVFYRTARGASPVKEFLDSLNGKQAQKVVWVLRLIEELPQIPAQYFKKMDGTSDLWEVRIQAGNDAFRLLGFFDGGKLVVLTNGFAKKTQKTPARELALAEQRKRDYLLRRGS
ncbi:MAG: type II toxin-antitoxin system RelE/ParE family toxin [Candidatus Promineofilum sp.]|jgi:phage-related protein|nr:type II toxin-antitoxin system RelE/ParE family toxin [Promineifilum sp.]